jgi:coronin-1B/1C/6
VLQFKHVYVEPAKPDLCYTNYKLSSATGEQNYIKGNTKFFAVALSGGGGPIAVVPYSRVGRWAPGMPVIAGHTAAVLDFDFNPFHENILATGSDDTSIKIWGIPADGLTENITDPLVDLHGHGRKVTLCKFHPTANHVLSTASSDFTVKVWDIEKGGELMTLSGGMEQLIQDISWDYTGAMMAVSSKDKGLRIFDPRTGAVEIEKKEAHEGSKSMKLTWLGPKGTLVSVGFTRQSQRQFKIWDIKKMDKEIKRVDIDQAAGVIMPFYDPDSSLLYLAGKGDGNVRYYEMTDSDPFCFPVSEYRSTTAAKGMAMIPKRGLNIMACETTRMLKLTSSSIEPLRFIVPRKSDAFQEDIFPDTFAGQPSLTADEWMAGENKPPVLMSLRPGGGGSIFAQAAQGDFVAPKSGIQWAKEVEEQKKTIDEQAAKIKELEEKLAAAGVA